MPGKRVNFVKLTARSWCVNLLCGVLKPSFWSGFYAKLHGCTSNCIARANDVSAFCHLALQMTQDAKMEQLILSHLMASWHKVSGEGNNWSSPEIMGCRKNCQKKFWLEN